ncbi:hypothetical protein STCU_10499 [Strigomonas culicis]|uniref:Uncharacterized protein n=1 Tax=Strigomonas culicis TaxID=28005 RepID=S9THX4_9TRYP|nr:hypothetical protein STCU_10499 [Strigomonas culicis]|eukprot:EPY17632.1 hypothetical protein STCU_10499 [Strigomonas culicis]
MAGQFPAVDFLPFSRAASKPNKKKKKVLSIEWCYVTSSAAESNFYMLQNAVPVQGANRKKLTYKTPEAAADGADPAADGSAAEAMEQNAVEHTPTAEVPIAASEMQDASSDVTLTEEEVAAAQLWYEKIHHYALDWNSLKL